MLRFAFRKLVQGAAMIIVVSALAFILLSSAGGDAFSTLRDNPQISETTIENLRSVYGLDQPIAIRYASWLANALRGDLGESFAFRVPVGPLAFARFLNTAMLAVAAFIFAALTSLLLAIFSTRFEGRILSATVELLILLTASTPRVVLALIALFLSLRFGFVFPESGGFSLFQFGAIVGALALPLVSIYLAQLKSGLAEAMNEDFTRLARAKGLGEWQIITRHAMRPVLNPFLTLAGLSFGGLLGGSVIVETVLGWPGIGALMVAAVRGRDVPLVMGIVVIASIAVWLANAAAEFLQLVNDKRLREGVIGQP